MHLVSIAAEIGDFWQEMRGNKHPENSLADIVIPINSNESE